MVREVYLWKEDRDGGVEGSFRRFVWWRSLVRAKGGAFMFRRRQ